MVHSKTHPSRTGASLTTPSADATALSRSSGFTNVCKSVFPFSRDTQRDIQISTVLYFEQTTWDYQELPSRFASHRRDEATLRLAGLSQRIFSQSPPYSTSCFKRLSCLTATNSNCRRRGQAPAGRSGPEKVPYSEIVQLSKCTTLCICAAAQCHYACEFSKQIKLSRPARHAAHFKAKQRCREH